MSASANLDFAMFQQAILTWADLSHKITASGHFGDIFSEPFAKIENAFEQIDQPKMAKRLIQLHKDFVPVYQQ